MRAVNLLPRETQRRRSRRVDPIVAGGAALTAVVLAGLGAGFAISHAHAASERQKLADAQAVLTALQAQEAASRASATPVLPQPAAMGQQGAWRLAVQTALDGRVAWDGLLADLARVVPGNVTVSNVTLGGSSGAASSLTLGGNAYSQQGVAQLLARLQLVSGVSQVELSSSSADPKSGVVTFGISAQVTMPTAAPPPATTTTAGGSA